MQARIKVLAISYGRNLFIEDDPERTRMEACATQVQEYHMIVFSKREHALERLVTQSGLVLHPTDSKTRFHMLFDAIAIARTLLREDTRRWVITAQDPFEAGLVGYVLKRMFRINMNVQEHGDFFSTLWWRRESILNRVRFLFGKWLLRKVDTVRVVSRRIERAMVAIGVDTKRLSVLSVRTNSPLGVEKQIPATFPVTSPEGSVVILSMARFVPQKNLTLLIDAFAEVYKEHQNALLVLVGSGPEQSKIEQRIQMHSLDAVVHIRPWTDNPLSYLQSADIYALSSNYEGWGRVLIEAMLTHTPVVTTDVGCVGEAFQDSIHGLVVPVHDTKKFAYALKTLVSDATLRSVLSGKDNKEAVSANLCVSQEQYTQQWVTILDKTHSISPR